MIDSEWVPPGVMWATTVVVIILCWEIAKQMLHSLRSPKSQGAPKASSIDEEDYPELKIPAHPHIESTLDPPTGLHCSNPSEAYAFENDYCKGKYIFVHPPTAEGVDGTWAEYFKGKSRLWELRVQLQFKRPPSPDTPEMYFGTELEEYVEMSSSVKRVNKMTVAAIRSAMGGVYQTDGDDPQTCSGELERPGCVLPLWAFDQFIVTPSGQEPPKLTDTNFPELGQKRYKRVSEYVEQLNAVKSNFDTVSTYTFASWGVSRFLDVINWRMLGIPVVTPIDFDKFVGKPPVFAVLYTLRPTSDDSETRHLPSRKQYYFRAAAWSSSKRPEKRRFEQLTGSALMDDGGGAPLLQKKGMWRRTKGFFRNKTTEMLTCCTSRPQE